MNTLHKKFLRGVQWNAIEKLCYNPLYFAHYALLFKVTDKVLYGLAGTLFASFYLIGTLVNIGLNSTIVGSFDLLTNSKKSFLRFLIPNLLPSLVILTLLIGALSIGNLEIPILSTIIDFSTMASLIDFPTFVIIVIAFILESFKKKCKTILQLAFKNRATALSEVGSFIIYLTILWTGYLFGFPISLKLIFFPLVISSSINLIILSFYVYQFYQSLPSENDTKILFNWNSILISRSINFLHDIGQLMFSSNFLVPLFALYCGLEQAGIFTLISSLCYSFTSFFQKVLGETGGAYLSNIKQENQEVKHATLLTLLNIANNILIGFVIFMAINYHTLVKFNGNQILAHENWSLIFFFLIFALSQNFFLIFEKFFITQNKPYYLLTITLSNALAFLFFKFSTMTSIQILMSIGLLRIFTFVVVIFLAFNALGKKPTLSIQPRYLVYSLVVSLSFFLMHYLHIPSFL